jgi:hypothetical protein
MKNTKNKLPKGVTKEPNGSYRARICKNGKIIHLGMFRNAIVARRAYLAAERKLK